MSFTNSVAAGEEVARLPVFWDVTTDLQINPITGERCYRSATRPRCSGVECQHRFEGAPLQRLRARWTSHHFTRHQSVQV